MGKGSRFLFFSFLVQVFMQTKTNPFIIAMIFTFSIILTGGGEGVLQRFSHNSGGTKIKRCSAFN